MSIIKHVTLQKIVAHDFRYDPRKIKLRTLLSNSNIFGMIKTKLVGRDGLRNITGLRMTLI